MSIICAPAEVVLNIVPKVACTSLKVMLYEINNSVSWTDRRVPFGRVHEMPGYQSLPFGKRDITGFEHFAKAAVVRNPVDRALSAYRDKARGAVLRGGPFEQRLKDAGLPLEPDPELFFSEISQYFECAPVIREHMRPFSYHLGDNLDYYEKVVRLEEVDEICSYLSEKIGKEVSLVASNSSRNSINSDKPISSAARKMRIDFCSGDIEFLSKYYTID